MIPCVVIYPGGVHVETMTPGLPAPGTWFEFHDSDRPGALVGVVTRVLCIEDDGEFTVYIETKEP